MKTLDQQLLRWAHDRVQEVVHMGPEHKDKYRTAVKGAPAFIQGCGLAQAIAFWEAKAKGATDLAKAKPEEYGYGAMLAHLGKGAPGLENLRAEARDSQVTQYVFLTTRTQAALVFLKRMVDAYLPKEEGDARSA